MNTLTKRIHNLPLELRLWCIIPYTYQLQNKELLRDIRTYHTDKNILDNVYGTQYNNNILLNDLNQFCLLKYVPLYISLTYPEGLIKTQIYISEMKNGKRVRTRYIPEKEALTLDEVQKTG